MLLLRGRKQGMLSWSFACSWLRSHWVLREIADDFINGRSYRSSSLAMAIGLIDHVWSWEEFLTYRHHNCSKR